MLAYPYNHTINPSTGTAMVEMVDFPDVKLELDGDYLSDLDVFEGTPNYNKVVQRIAVSMADRRRAGAVIPVPSAPLRGQRVLNLPAYIPAKLALAQLMDANNVRNLDLAGHMKCSPSNISQLLDLTNPSKIDTLLTALRQLGVTPDMGFMYSDWYDYHSVAKRHAAEWDSAVRLTAVGSQRFWNFIARHARPFVPPGNYLSSMQYAMIACRYDSKELVWTLERAFSSDKEAHKLTMTEGQHILFVPQPGDRDR
ncbi:hypothetical protein [Achromobacter insolitus]|uniref:hypothetical protein n=1 Tax=Achromobacter insolitus TaxID=217204 RepID=UPI00241CACBF|nr:hypothetical protein [Achromobacter insolitus]